MIPAPLRSQVRDAIERAWAAAIESGALPPLSDDAARPSIDVDRPANPEHGDLATNLAMKLARPYRKPPMEIATLLAAKLVRDASATDSPIEAAEVAPPGFVNLRLRPDGLAAIVDGILAEPDGMGDGGAGPAACRQRGIRVGQPDRPADDRQRARSVHR